MEEEEMGFPGSSRAVMKDGAGETARGKSSRGGTGAPSTPQTNPSVLRGTLPQWGRCNVKALRSWKVLGISLEGKEPRGAAFVGLHKPFPAPERPWGSAAPGDGSISNQASLASPLTERLGLHTDLLLRVLARLPASTGIANNPVSPALRSTSLPSITRTRGCPDHLQIRPQAAPKPAAGAGDHPAARRRAAASLLRGG